MLDKKPVYAITTGANECYFHLVPPHLTGKITRRCEFIAHRTVLLIIDHGSKGPVGIQLIFLYKENHRESS